MLIVGECRASAAPNYEAKTRSNYGHVATRIHRVTAISARRPLQGARAAARHRAAAGSQRGRARCGPDRRCHALLQRVGCQRGSPGAEDLRRGYLDVGTDALRSFTDSRIGSMERLAGAIQDKPALFAKARTCEAALPGVRARVAEALDRLGTLLPTARFPPVTVLVGRGNSGGVTTEAGVVIGLEALCNADWMQPDVGDRFVHLIAHEYVHVQQPGTRSEVEQPTLLYDVA